MGDLDGVLSSWLLPGPALAVEAIWEVTPVDTSPLTLPFQKKVYLIYTILIDFVNDFKIKKKPLILKFFTLFSI